MLHNAVDAVAICRNQNRTNGFSIADNGHSGLNVPLSFFFIEPRTVLAA